MIYKSNITNTSHKKLYVSTGNPHDLSSRSLNFKKNDGNMELFDSVRHRHIEASLGILNPSNALTQYIFIRGENDLECN